MKRLMCLVAVSVAAVLVLAPAALAQTGDLNCVAFANQEAAQAILDENPGDPYQFDVDGDGIACEDVGGGTAEDGTLAPFAQGAQLADTGGPPLMPLMLLVGAAMMLLLGARLAMAAFSVGEHSSRVGALSEGQRALMNIGGNRMRLVLIVLSAALAILLIIVLGSGAVGPTNPASAQGTDRPAISTAVYPTPTDAIPVGTTMDFLITKYNTSNTHRRVTVNDQLPGGVSYVGATASQGNCYPMADEPTINCTLGTIPPKGVAYINVVVTAESRGSYSNLVSDNHGNEASADFTIVRRQ